MVKPLVFKGEKRPKKRKAPNTAVLDASSAAAAHQINSENLTSSIEDDSWVSAEVPSDILGPVVLILPSVPPTCLACDQNGKVYASEIENIIEGEVATAEPHDKRQVWVATRVAGTEKVSFKGHHGRYVIFFPSCQ
jgi:protein FRG1